MGGRGRILILFFLCVIWGLAVRWPALSYPYFCWDEHDYIAHNIYARALGHFEVPYSNKWPLGHALIYLLTRPFNPFTIEAYRIATTIVDAAAAALITVWIGKRRVVHAAVVTLVYFLITSVCLRSSPGILAEQLANLPLIAAALTLSAVPFSKIKWPVSILCLAAACLIKPTAVFPGGGLLLGHLYMISRQHRKSILGEGLQVFVWSSIVIALLVGLYSTNAWNVQKYFWRSAVVYNTSASVFGTRPMRQYADFLFSGFAFFQYLTPALILAVLAFARSVKGTRECASNSSLAPAAGMLTGASVSLLLRPAGGQTTYWLYILPPLFFCAVAGYRSLISGGFRQWRFVVAAVSLAPLVYAWALVIYGQPRAIIFGGSGGLQMTQAQVEVIMPTVKALNSDPRFLPQQTRALVWGMEWQFFYFAKAIPASSILTNETWFYRVDRPWQEMELRRDVEMSARLIVTEKAELPSWLESIVTQGFSAVFEGEHQNVYLKN